MALYHISTIRCTPSLSFLTILNLKFFNSTRYQSFWLFVGMSLCLLFKRVKLLFAFIKNLFIFLYNLFLPTQRSKSAVGKEKKDVPEGTTPEAAKKKVWHPMHLLFPAACDALATIVDSLGLIYVHKIFFITI
jgi:hypothetical protein